MKFILLSMILAAPLLGSAASLSLSSGYAGSIFDASGQNYFYENVVYRASLMTSRKEKIRLGLAYTTGQLVRESTIDSNVPRFINDIQGELFMNIAIDKNRTSFIHIGGIYGQFQTSDQRSFFSQKATIEQYGGTVGGGVYLINGSFIRFCLEAYIGYIKMTELDALARRQIMTFLSFEFGGNGD